MKRLTTNKEVSEMNMLELAHNSCYAKENKARYRDYERDIDARKLAIKLLDRFADIPNEFTCDEDFDEFILDSLQYGTDNMLGLIALFYRNLCAQADLYERLKHYEDVEEQGLLLKLPCKVGDNVYFINHVLCKNTKTPIRCTIDEFTFDKNNRCYAVLNGDMSVYMRRRFIAVDIEKIFGNTVFLTQAEAEEALKEMGRKI